MEQKVKLKTNYKFECYDRWGNLKWRDGFDNLVVIAGLNDALDKHFKASAYTSAWYVGLASGSPTFALVDSMAAHAGWAEVVDYTEANRQTLTLGSIVSGSVDNSASKAVYTISGTITVGGAFLTTYQTKGITSGTLYGGGAFSGGNRQVFAGDTLNVTLTLTASN